MSKISMKKISEVLRQKFDLHRSHRDIANSLNISAGTVANYLSRARATGLVWPLPDDLTEEALYKLLFLPSSKPAKNKPKPNWPYIHQESRKKGITLQLLWREYRDSYSEGLSYSQFCKHYLSFKKTLTPVMRQQHKAGEKAFVDYSGLKIDWINPVSGEIFTAEVFVGCLGASQYIFACLLYTSPSPRDA